MSSNAVTLRPFPTSNPSIGGISWFQLVLTGTSLCWTLLDRTEGTYVIGLQDRASPTDFPHYQRQLFYALPTPITSPPPTSPDQPPLVFFVAYLPWIAYGQVWDSGTPVCGIEPTFAQYVTPQESQTTGQSYAAQLKKTGVFNSSYINFMTSSRNPQTEGQQITADGQGIFGLLLRGAVTNDPDTVLLFENHPVGVDLFPIVQPVALTARALYEGALLVIAAQAGFPGRTMQINPPTGPVDCNNDYTVQSATDSSIFTGGDPTTDVFGLEFIDDDTFCVRFTPSNPQCFWYLRGVGFSVQATATDVHTRFNDTSFQWRAPLTSGATSLSVYTWSLFEQGGAGVLSTTPPSRTFVNVFTGFVWSWNGTGTLVTPAVAAIQRQQFTSPGNEGVLCYLYSVEDDNTQVGVLTDVLNRPLDLSICCTEPNLTAAFRDVCTTITDLTAQSLTCDNFMTSVCTLQAPDNTVSSCQCFWPPVEGIPGIPSQYDLCFDQQCWSSVTNAYRTAEMQAVTSCPKSICIQALKTLFREVFYRGDFTADCSLISDANPAPPPPSFPSQPDNGGETGTLPDSNEYSVFIDWCIGGAFLIVLFILIAACVTLVRWRDYRKQALRDAGVGSKPVTRDLRPHPRTIEPVKVPVSIVPSASSR